MDQQPIKKDSSGSALLIVGLLLGAGVLAMMVWDSTRSEPSPESGGGSGEVIQLTAANWQREVGQSQVPVLVDFTAKWCGPCRALAPTIDRIAEKYKGKVKVGKVDIDKSPDLAEKFQVEGIPHLVLITPGSSRMVNRSLYSDAGLSQALDELLARN